MLGIQLERKSEISIKRQLYQSIRESITSGRLAAGDVLPSTRELARALGVSRNTVCEAYDMLLSEGYTVSSQGTLTKVAEGLYMEKKTEKRLPLKDDGKKTWLVDFGTGKPDLREFPEFLWKQMVIAAYDKMNGRQMGYTDPQGLPGLRCEISEWLFRIRGITAAPEDIFITSGATQALHVVADLLCGTGKKIIMEDPCHSGMLQTFRIKGCDILPIPVDEQGMQTEYLKEMAPDRSVSAIYVTPSHQFPLGGILPAPRRASLIRFAEEKGIYLIEDDYDSEFRYCGEPITPLYGMDPERVIYVGTFSKTLFPALRIGYAILPRQIHAAWKHLRMHMDVQNPVLEQWALAEFLRMRKMDRYLLKMKRIYAERRKTLLYVMNQIFTTIPWSTWGDAAGLHLAVKFEDREFDESFFRICSDSGVRITSVESHAICKGKHRDMLLFGYGHLSPEEIAKGLSVLESCMKLWL